MREGREGEAKEGEGQGERGRGERKRARRGERGMSKEREVSFAHMGNGDESRVRRDVVRVHTVTAEAPHCSKKGKILCTVGHFSSLPVRTFMVNGTERIELTPRIISSILRGASRRAEPGGRGRGGGKVRKEGRRKGGGAQKKVARTKKGAIEKQTKKRKTHRRENNREERGRERREEERRERREISDTDRNIPAPLL